MPWEYAEESKKSVMLGTSHTKEGLRIETEQDGECKASEFSTPLVISSCNPEVNSPY